MLKRIRSFQNSSLTGSRDDGARWLTVVPATVGYNAVRRHRLSRNAVRCRFQTTQVERLDVASIFVMTGNSITRDAVTPSFFGARGRVQGRYLGGQLKTGHLSTGQNRPFLAAAETE